MHILVTGGAGFIGSFLTDELIRRGHSVRVLDNLEEQVHHGKEPAYMNAKAEYVWGDVRDYDVVKKALQGVEAVCHMASAVGVAQSQYEIKRYADCNVGGTANLLDVIVNEKLPIKKFLLPTSMTAYGEGVYRCTEHGDIRPGIRREEQLKRRDWSLYCPECKREVLPVPTTEDALKQSATMYALTKQMQEDMVFSIATTYGFAATALRLFNVYGPRQSLSNPYTGVTAIFLSRLKNDQQPVLFEDGLQSRDFISVHDVVRAFVLALESDHAAGQVLNIGSGKATSIKDIAVTLASLLGKDIQPRINGEFRKNDVRHCVADTRKAKELLGWQPEVSFEQGMKELIEWGEKEEATDHFAEAQKILQAKKLSV